MAARTIEYMPVADLPEAPRNPKAHAEDELTASMARFGYVEPIILDERTGRIVSGHGRKHELLRGQEAGEAPPDGVLVADDGSWLAPVSRGWASKDDAEAEAFVIAANRIGERGGWHNDLLAEVLADLGKIEGGLEGVGYDLDDLQRLRGALDDLDAAPPEPPAPAGPSLAERFGVPPFSVLDARQGYWQERKRQWLDLGIRSEVGRGHNLLKLSDTVLAAQRSGREVAEHAAADPAYAWKKAEVEKRLGRELTDAEFLAEHYESDAYVGGTSIFDPVVCELAYRWYCPPGGSVLDPFAGGSVRGVVAAWLGHPYLGVDLREEQVAANEEQWASIGRGRPDAPPPAWAVGDARDVVPGLGGRYDLVFSCPPYFDLEVYSDDPRDLSTGSWDDFLAGYAGIIRSAVDQLADDRFAVWVVGDLRDSKGRLRDLPGETVRLFAEAGASLYNDAILVTAVGSLALRAGRIFAGGRKLARTHQYVLVFAKGDGARAAAACGPVEVIDVAEMFGVPVPPEPAADQEERPPAAAGAPAWAKGYAVPALKEVAALFAEHDEGLILGAFTKVKETAVADWAAAGQLLLARDAESGELVAAASVSRPSRPRPWTDFADHKLGDPKPGDLVVRRVAWRHGRADAAAGLIEREWGHAGRLWADLWQEHPGDRSLADALGLTWQGTKIRASSELVGVWASDLPEATLSLAEWAGLARLDFSFDPAELLGQLDAAGLAWADHYAVYNKRSSWSALALRGYGGDPDFIIKPSEMSKGWKAEHPEALELSIEDTPLLDKLPAARSLMEAVPGAKHRVRLMRLAPGDGELTRHADITDPDAGVEPGQLLRIHLPLRTNPEVRFTSWLPDGSACSANFGEGEAWYLDTRKPHTAVNGGPAERIHLVMDVESTPELLALICDLAPVAKDKPQPEPIEPMAPWTNSRL